MTKKLLITFVMAVCVLALSITSFAGCNDNSSDTTPQVETQVVTDMLGRQLEVSKNIDKVVCIGAGALRLYSYVGDVNKLCAVEEIDGTRTTGRISQRAYQIANEQLFKSLIEDGKTAGAGGPQAQKLDSDNIERLAKLAPDVVFSCLTLEQDALESAEKVINCPIVTLKYGQAKAFSDEIQQSIKLIGKICQKEARATELCNYMNTLKADLASLAQGKTSSSVYLACNSNWGVKGFLSTSKKYPLFTISGIDNVIDGEGFTLTDGFADLEAVVASGADKIILDAGGLETFKNDYQEAGSNLPSALEGMDAFKNKEVYLIMPNNAYDANVETYFINAYYCLSVAYGIEIDIAAKANEITTAFLGKALYNDIIMYGGYQKLDLPDTWPTK